MVWLHNPGDIRTLLSKEGSMPILPSMNTFIELRQEDDYQEIFHEGTGLISQVLVISKLVLGFKIFSRARPGTSSAKQFRRT